VHQHLREEAGLGLLTRSHYILPSREELSVDVKRYTKIGSHALESQNASSAFN